MKLDKYLEIREKIKTGDMLEWRSYSIVGKTIRFFTKANVNHTSLCIALDQYINYDVPHKFILEANSGGIDLNLISRELETFDGEVWWSALKPQFDNKRDGIAKWSLLQVGIKYDWGSLFKNSVSHVNVDARKYFCSEFYFSALKEQKIVWNGLVPRPGEFGKYNIHEKAVRIL